MSDTDIGDEDAPQLDPLQQALGATGESHLDAAAGTARVHYRVKPAFCHTGGIAQGGFVTGWIDAAMAHACIARYGEGYWVATLELKVSFFRPATPGTVVAEGWIERAGKQTVFAEGRLLDDDDQVLAKASSTIRLVENRA